MSTCLFKPDLMIHHQVSCTVSRVEPQENFLKCTRTQLKIPGPGIFGAMDITVEVLEQEIWKGFQDMSEIRTNTMWRNQAEEPTGFQPVEWSVFLFLITPRLARYIKLFRTLKTLLSVLVPGEGIEPSRACAQMFLRHLCIPVSAPRQALLEL